MRSILYSRTSPLDEPKVEDCENDRIENRLVITVEGTVYENITAAELGRALNASLLRDDCARPFQPPSL